MCTATWFHDEAGYNLFFNRDELRTRRPAVPPDRRGPPGHRFIAPADGDFGGSWISVNPSGLSLALLNGYVADDQATGRTFESRGALVTALANSRSLEQTCDRLGSEDLDRFRSFRLLVVSPEDICLADWRDGCLEFVRRADLPMPLVSSSFATDAVCRSRVEQARDLGEWETIDGRVESHLDYHAGHCPERGPYSVCMHRPNARTVSFSWIRVTADRVRFSYTPRPPHEGIEREPSTVLPRNRADAQ